MLIFLIQKWIFISVMYVGILKLHEWENSVKPALAVITYVKLVLIYAVPTLLFLDYLKQIPGIIFCKLFITLV